MSRAAIGVDLGGTKIEAVLLADGVERQRLRVPTPRDDYDATLAAIAALVATLDEKAGCRATVGIGIPGSVEPSTGLVKNANSVWLIGRPLEKDLCRRLGRPIVVANDANCFALSEASDGAASGGDVVFAVILGTGVGAGVSIGRRVRAGANGVSGEWGHNPLPWMRADEYPGRVCYCGKRGCVETFLSGPALSADYQQSTGDAVSAEEIVRRAQTGDPKADAAMVCYEHRAARALAAVINVLDPDVIVLGGGLSQIARLYTNIPRLWGEFVFNCAAGGSPPPGSAPRPAVRTTLRQARHGDSSGVRGAAWLGDSQLSAVQ